MFCVSQRVSKSSILSSKELRHRFSDLHMVFKIKNFVCQRKKIFRLVLSHLLRRYEEMGYLAHPAPRCLSAGLLLSLIGYKKLLLRPVGILAICHGYCSVYKVGHLGKRQKRKGHEYKYKVYKIQPVRNASPAN